MQQQQKRLPGRVRGRVDDEYDAEDEREKTEVAAETAQAAGGGGQIASIAVPTGPGVTTTTLHAPRQSPA